MSGDHIVCIERRPGLSSVFEDFFHNQRLVDVTLKCSDGQIHAHKLVLAASSDYFSNLFDDLANPFHYPVVVLKDMRIEDLSLIIEFMYRGRLSISQKRLDDLIKCAENLQIIGLTATEKDLGQNHVVEQQQVSTEDNADNHETSHAMTERPTARKNKMTMYQSTTTLLEQSLITEQTPDDRYTSTQVSSYFNRGVPNFSNQQIHSSPVTSMRHVQQHLSSIDRQQHLLTQRQQQLSNHLQVLTHSLGTNRSANHKTKSGQRNRQLTQGSRVQDHICNICFVSFSRKANLERHLQNLHSIFRENQTTSHMR